MLDVVSKQKPSGQLTAVGGAKAVKPGLHCLLDCCIWSAIWCLVIDDQLALKIKVSIF